MSPFPIEILPRCYLHFSTWIPAHLDKSDRQLFFNKIMFAIEPCQCPYNVFEKMWSVSVSVSWWQFYAYGVTRWQARRRRPLWRIQSICTSQYAIHSQCTNRLTQKDGIFCSYKMSSIFLTYTKIIINFRNIFFYTSFPTYFHWNLHGLCSVKSEVCGTFNFMPSLPFRIQQFIKKCFINAAIIIFLSLLLNYELGSCQWSNWQLFLLSALFD